jgi:hypothetical protein
MPWYLRALSSPLAVDVQRNPLPAIFLAAVVCVLLWFLVSLARRRDERRAGRKRDLSGWRSRQPPRY